VAPWVRLAPPIDSSSWTDDKSPTEPQRTPIPELCSVTIHSFKPEQCKWLKPQTTLVTHRDTLLLSHNWLLVVTVGICMNQPHPSSLCRLYQAVMVTATKHFLYLKRSLQEVRWAVQLRLWLILVIMTQNDSSVTIDMTVTIATIHTMIPAITPTVTTCRRFWVRWKCLLACQPVHISIHRLSKRCSLLASHWMLSWKACHCLLQRRRISQNCAHTKT